MSAFPFLSRYRLTRNFAIGAVIVMILAAAGLAQINRYLAAVQVQGMAARNNVSLSQTITNSLWPRFSGTFRWAQEFDADTIRENPQSEELLRDVHTLIAGTNVLRIKFYDPRGRTVFSSEAAQIGGDYSEDRHFLAALGGDVASVL